MAAVPFFLGHLRFSGTCPAAAALLEFSAWLTQVGWPTPAMDVCCGVGGVLVPHLVFYLVPALLPLSGFCPLLLLLLTLRGCGSLSGSSLLVFSCGGALWLGWRGNCCATWVSTMCRALPQGLTACAAFPAAGSRGVFRSQGVCPSASLVT